MEKFGGDQRPGGRVKVDLLVTEIGRAVLLAPYDDSVIGFRNEFQDLAPDERLIRLLAQHKNVPSAQS
jgi:hypothetical protein